MDIEALLEPLRPHPELAVFLTLGVGSLVGKLSVGGVKRGAVAGVSLTGVAVGRIGVHVSDDLKQVMCLLFLFSIGYKVGPPFFRGFKSDGAQQMPVAVVFCVACLQAGWSSAKTFGHDLGTAAGLLAGALTESATIGVATDAMGKLGAPAPTADSASGPPPLASERAAANLSGVGPYGPHRSAQRRTHRSHEAPR